MSALIRDSTQEYRWGARERKTIDNTSGGVSLTSSVYKPTTGDFKGMCAQIAKCNLETADIRYTKDGSTSPTASIGRYVYETGEFYLFGSQEIKNFKGIRVSAVSGVLDVEYGW